MFKNKRTAMVEVLVLAVFLSLLILMTPGKASAVMECYLKAKGTKQGDIKGEGTKKGYENLIQIMSWSFNGTIPAGAPVGAGTITMQDFKVTMNTTAASPKLFQAFVTKEVLTEFVLSALGLNRAGAMYCFMKITLTQAMVSSIINLGNTKSADTRSMEEVTFRFSKIRIEYIPEAGGPIVVEYQPQQPLL
jgi:type VI secretion system secreted protein Hcp